MNRLKISLSPHIHSGASTQRIMLYVLLSLVPALAVAVVVYGYMTLVITAFSVACCLFFEWAIQRFMLKGRRTIGDLSAVLTGVLLAFNLPATIPIWMVALGALVAIGVAKMSFGGLGNNLFNPALVGRVFLLVSFPVAMTTFGTPGGVDALSGETPLAFARIALKDGQNVSEIMSQISSVDLLAGITGGSFGEISVIALVLGGLFLLWRRVISWHIPVAVLGSMALFGGVLWLFQPESYMSPLFHLITGGAILGAFYMATDYVTSPMSRRGMIIFGVGIGTITMCIRFWGAYPEGMSFAILIMNAMVPLIDKYTRPRPFAKTIPRKKQKK